MPQGIQNSHSQSGIRVMLHAPPVTKELEGPIRAERALLISIIRLEQKHPHVMSLVDWGHARPESAFASKLRERKAAVRAGEGRRGRHLDPNQQAPGKEPVQRATPPSPLIPEAAAAPGWCVVPRGPIGRRRGGRRGQWEGGAARPVAISAREAESESERRGARSAGAALLCLADAVSASA